jgi:glycosyltransferase involved in cell wall biosynthesis
MLPGKEREAGTIYNGIDHTRYRPAKNAAERAQIREQFGLDAETRYLVCVGTPVALKGWMELLSAIKELGDDFAGWQLLMVAPKRVNPDAIDLEQASRDMGIATNCKAMGELTPSALASLFRACDAFALPSYNEGMANSLLEAMATGLPCIATEVGGHNEVIENGKSGLLIQPRSVEQITAAIKTLIADEALRTAMGAAARERMLALGDYKQNAAKLLELMRQCPRQ